MRETVGGTYSSRDFLLLACVGALAGTLNGLIGTGGGIVIIYAVGKMASAGRGGLSRRDVFATAVASVLPISAVSAVIYAVGGVDLPAGAGRFAVPAVLGGVIGGFALDRVKGKIVSAIFSLLVMWAGISLLLRSAGVL